MKLEWIEHELEKSLAGAPVGKNVYDAAMLITVRDEMKKDSPMPVHERAQEENKHYHTAAIPHHHTDETHRHITQNRSSGKLTMQDADTWVRSMRAADGTVGGRWKNICDVKPLADRMGLPSEEMVEFFAIINAMYSDYCKVAKKHGVDKPEFYADLAKAWIHDEDAEENKAMLYYDCIVKKQ